MKLVHFILYILIFIYPTIIKENLKILRTDFLLQKMTLQIKIFFKSNFQIQPVVYEFTVRYHQPVSMTMAVMLFQVNVGSALGMRTGAVLSRMDATIGRYVGNSLEVIESLETLKGNGPDDLMELVTTLGNDSTLYPEVSTKINDVTSYLFIGFDEPGRDETSPVDRRKFSEPRT